LLHHFDPKVWPRPPTHLTAEDYSGSLDGGWANEVLLDGAWQPLVVEAPKSKSRNEVTVGGKTVKVKKVRMRKPKPAQKPPTIPLDKDSWARNPALERAIKADLDGVEPYLVYGDWLQSQGDPRGALITTMHAALERPEMQAPAAEAADAFASELLGEFLPFLDFRWRLGFVEKLLLHQRKDADYPSILERAFAHPALAFLRFFAFNFSLPKKARPDMVVAMLSQLSTKADTLDALNLSGSTCFDRIADVRLLAPLTNVTWLDLDETKCKSLEGLGELSNLRELSMRYVPVKSLAPLAALGELRKLTTSNLKLSDLTPLTQLQKLEELDLSGAACHDLSPLLELKKLKRLNITRTPITSVEPLAQLENLELLEAWFVDADFSPLERLFPKLELSTNR
jgi:uncharacterized protein (TIGR02996 family)